MEAVADTVRRLRSRVSELERLVETLEQESREKSLYLASMSHEMKAPLNAINGFAELLADPSYGALNPEQQRFAARVSEAGQHLLQLINDVIEIARIDSGRLDVELKPVPLNPLAEQVVLISRGLARDRDVSVRFTAAAGDPVVLADERRLKQVLFNLISNAAKYSAPDSVVQVSAQVEDGRATVRVTDQGIGVAAADQERIFQVFERTLPATRMAEGAGLGLPLSRRLVEMQGGDIGLTSEPGQGSTFWFTVPIVGPSKADSPESADGKQAARRG